MAKKEKVTDSAKIENDSDAVVAETTPNATESVVADLPKTAKVEKVEKAVSSVPAGMIAIISTQIKDQKVSIAAGQIAFDANGNATVTEAQLKALTPFFEAFKIIVRK